MYTVLDNHHVPHQQTMKVTWLQDKYGCVKFNIFTWQNTAVCSELQHCMTRMNISCRICRQFVVSTEPACHFFQHKLLSRKKCVTDCQLSGDRYNMLADKLMLAADWSVLLFIHFLCISRTIHHSYRRKMLCFTNSVTSEIQHTMNYYCDTVQRQYRSLGLSMREYLT